MWAPGQGCSRPRPRTSPPLPGLSLPSGSPGPGPPEPRFLSTPKGLKILHVLNHSTVGVTGGVCVCELSHCRRVRLLVTPRTAAYQAPLSMGFSRQKQWSGLPCPFPGDLPDPGIKPTSLFSPALAGRFCTTRATWEAQPAATNDHKLDILKQLESIVPQSWGPGV